METNRKAKIKELDAKRTVLNIEINKLTEAEEREVVSPKCRALVGVCLKSTYGDDSGYAKLLEIVDTPEYGMYFLMERFYTTKQGSTYFFTDSCYPYTNKEWWDADIPISGWERVSEEKYQQEKAKAWQEFTSMKILRKFLLKQK